MDVRTCKKCGNLFNYLSGPPLCPKCRDEMEKKFHEVKEFIRENPNANINEIAQENEVPVAQIQQWVREERLEFTEGSAITLSCESCGASIRTGRFCEKCKGNMSNALNSAFKKPTVEAPVKKPKESDKMRFLK